MQPRTLKHAFFQLCAVTLVVAGLSYFAHVPYAFTMLAILAWGFLGHLVTLDDDMPGGWSNPEESQAHWRASLLGLVAKLVLLVAVFGLVAYFPFLKTLGA